MNSEFGIRNPPAAATRGRGRKGRVVGGPPIGHSLATVRHGAPRGASNSEWRPPESDSCGGSRADIQNSEFKTQNSACHPPDLESLGGSWAVIQNSKFKIQNSNRRSDS